MPTDPRALLRSRSYLGSWSSPRSSGFRSRPPPTVPQLVAHLQQWFFTTLPTASASARRRCGGRSPLLAIAGVLVALPSSTCPAPPATAGRGVQSRRARHRRRAPGRHPGLAGHAEPRGRPRSRGAAHRHRRRPGPAGPPLAKRDAPPSHGGGHRLGRQLRRHQHPARLTHRRRVPADGGVRPGWAPAGPGAGARPAGRRHRLPDLHRPGQLDRVRHVLPGHPGPAPVQPRPTVAVFLWAIAFGLVAACSARPSAGWACPAAGGRAPQTAAHALVGPGRRRPGHPLRRSDRASLAEVLFSGQNALGPCSRREPVTVGALVLLVACKCVAYGLSLSSFRGGPIFPHVHRRGGGWRLPPPRPLGCRRWPWASGPWRDAEAAPDLGAADHAAPGLTAWRDPLVIVAVVVTYVASARITPSRLSRRQPHGPRLRDPP